MEDALSTWTPGPECPEMVERTLHVWRIHLDDADETTLTSERLLLSPDEQIRADRFVVEPPRRQFIRTRAAMRNILARYIGTSPRSIVFTPGKHGKLFVKDHRLRFNLSHSGNHALFAAIYDHEVGIDIEYMDRHRAGDDIARRFFSAAEQAELSSYGGAEKERAFFRCWSRKEAVIKALGEGLACPLDSFDVRIDEQNAGLLALRRTDADISTWKMFSIDVHPDYAAAAAVIGPCERIIGFNFV